jgi:hypothetical protein
MSHEWHEALLSLQGRFRALKTERDLVHQAWQAGVRERDSARQSSLMTHEGDLLLEASAVISALQQLIAHELMRTQA